MRISFAYISASVLNSLIQKQTETEEEISNQCLGSVLEVIKTLFHCEFTPLIDNSTVLYFDFEDDGDGYIEDLSGNENTGYLYGNTRLLLHFDEGGGEYVYDKTVWNNTGILGNDTGTSHNPTWITDKSKCISNSCLKFDGEDDMSTFHGNTQTRYGKNSQ